MVFSWICSFRSLGLEFCSLCVWFWDSVLRFVAWCLVFEILDFGILNLGFWYGIWNFGVWDFEFLEFENLGFCFWFWD